MSWKTYLHSPFVPAALVSSVPSIPCQSKCGEGQSLRHGAGQGAGGGAAGVDRNVLNDAY